MAKTKESQHDSAIEQLIAGYQRFRDGYYETHHERLIRLAQAGQSPRVAVVACCDSRVDPAIITDSAPGELFVIRNVANLVPPCEGEGNWHSTCAALQFAVCNLQIEHLIVLGHARCGGIHSLMEEQKNGHQDGFISTWMNIAAEAREIALSRTDLQTFAERAHCCELHAIAISLDNLKTFSWIRERVAQKHLQLHGWYYDMVSGELLGLDDDASAFASLTCKETRKVPL